MLKRNGLEVFRIITPALITAVLAILGVIYSDLNKIKDTVVMLQVDMASVKEQISSLKSHTKEHGH